MSLGTCRRVSCCNSESGVEFSPFTYNLVNGGSYTNSETTFIIPCPVGYDCTGDSVTITLPPGTIRFNPADLDPNPPPSGGGGPWNPAAGKYTFNCGDETLTITTTGSGFTQAQLDQIIAFLAQCQANQDGNAILNPVPVLTPIGEPGLRLWNTEQTCIVNCTQGEGSATATVAANTISSVVAQSATPLAKYLAQQTLNASAYNAACTQAQAELVCTCADYSCTLAGSFAANFSTGCIYAASSDTVFVQQDSAVILVVNPDTLDVDATINLPTGQRPLCLGYHADSQRVYVGAVHDVDDQSWLHTINPLTNAIVSSQLLDAETNLTQFAEDRANGKMFLLAGTAFRVWSIDIGTGLATLTSITGFNGLGIAVCPVADILAISDNFDLKLYDLTSFDLLVTFTPANFPGMLAFCPDTNELFSMDFLGNQLLVWDMQANLSTVTVGDFNAPAFNANIAIVVDDESGMYVGRNFTINGIEWELVSVDAPGQITVKNLLVTPGTTISGGSAVAWTGTENSSTIALGGACAGVQYDYQHHKIVTLAAISSVSHFKVIEPEDHTVTCDVVVPGVMSHGMAFTANCRAFLSDPGVFIDPHNLVNVIS